MGAGKTTAAEFLTDHLQRNGIAARFLPEGPTISEREHPLRIGPTLPHPRAVWLDATIDEYVASSLAKWRAFAREADAAATVTVCDGLLFHGNMTDVLLMDAERQVVQRYVTTVVEIIHSLKPTLIYFRHADIARAVRAVCDERGSEWEAMQVAWKVGSPYGVRRELRGFEGLVELYQGYPGQSHLNFGWFSPTFLRDSAPLTVIPSPDPPRSAPRNGDCGPRRPLGKSGGCDSSVDESSERRRYGETDLDAIALDIFG